MILTRQELQHPGKDQPMTTSLAVELPRDTAQVQLPTCPLCHTLDHIMTNDALAAGGIWTCARCGQRWTAARLATFAAYARSVASRLAVTA